MSTATRPVLTHCGTAKPKLSERGGDPDRARVRAGTQQARIDNPLGDYSEQTGALFG